MRDILLSVDVPYLVKRVYFRRESSMEAKDLVVNNCGDGKALKDLSEKFPDEVSVIFF
jgi:hypothetical protein